MNVWEVRCANVNDYSMVVPAIEEDIVAGLFRIDGSPLDWKSRPIVEYSDDRSRGKKKRPVADVSLMVPGCLILSRNAYDALGDFFGAFGQLLEVQTVGGKEFRYLYNVTTVVKCVDLERSEKFASNTIRNEVFYDINVPRTAAIFKDPSTAKVRIYANDPGREMIERKTSEWGLTGIECGVPTRR